ncbi:MAG TPA: Pr6Pr family membrane protein [Puia sp.]|jgi:hypothetical protein
MNNKPYARTVAAIAALAGWISLVVQFVLLIENRVTAVPEAILRYFTYFTILTNILAAVTFTAIWTDPAAGWLKKLVSPPWISAVTLYMTVVGVIYNTVLRNLLVLYGAGFIVNEFLHVILPLSILFFWIVYVRRSELKWKMALTWLLYPVGYILLVMLVGWQTGFYPYPFANAGKLGYPRALTNGFWVLTGFLVLSLVLIGFGKIKTKK